MSECSLCNKPSENLRDYKNYTTSPWSQSATKKVGYKRYRTTTYSGESDIQSHSYQVCKSCILKRDFIPGFGTLFVGITIGILIALNNHSPGTGLGGFLLYFCFTSILILSVGWGIWLFSISVERSLVRKSIQSRIRFKEDKYKGYTEGEWIARQKKS